MGRAPVFRIPVSGSGSIPSRRMGAGFSSKAARSESRSSLRCSKAEMLADLHVAVAVVVAKARLPFVIALALSESNIDTRDTLRERGRGRGRFLTVRCRHSRNTQLASCCLRRLRAHKTSNSTITAPSRRPAPSSTNAPVCTVELPV